MSKSNEQLETTQSKTLTFQEVALPQLSNAIPLELQQAGLTPERVFKIAISYFNKNPKLAACTSESKLNCMIEIGEIGLDLNQSSGQIYVVPYKKEAKVIVGYKGYLEILWRTGRVKSLSSIIVYEKDEFNYELGLNEKCDHKPSLLPISKRGKITHSYFIVRFKDGGHHLEVMDIEQINKSRDKSPGAKREDSAWKTDYEAMVRKTPIRKAFTFLPKSMMPKETVKALAKIEHQDWDNTPQSRPDLLADGKHDINQKPEPDENTIDV